jgi:hypothetical protein
MVPAAVMIFSMIAIPVAFGTLDALESAKDRAERLEHGAITQTSNGG